MAKYPTNVFVDFIDRTVLEIYNKRFGIQFLLRLDNMDSESERQVTVVLLHPTQAEQFESDPDINKMIRYFSKRDFQEISFISLFPYRVATASDFRDLLLEDQLADILEQNSERIREQLHRSELFVLAWDDRPAYIPIQRFDAATQFMENLVEEQEMESKTKVFRFSKDSSYTEKGNPKNVNNRVIEETIPYLRKLLRPKI